MLSAIYKHDFLACSFGGRPKLSAPRQWSESEQVTQLQRQIKGLRTQIQNLKAENLMLAERFRADRTAITKAERRRLLKIFHPDVGTYATKKQLEEAAQIFAAIKFNFLD